MSFGKHGQGGRMDEWSRMVQTIMDEMRNRIFFEYRATGTWVPRINLYASRSAYHICVELAGLERDLVCVECIGDQRLRITGRRPQPRVGILESPFSVEVMEVDEGPFSREIDLPEPVDGNLIEVSYDRGYLWITVPKIQPK
jgi:HSP20 family molecular chaperone IbpA